MNSSSQGPGAVKVAGAILSISSAVSVVICFDYIPVLF
jgi:hypothetical protein